tara:strand:+ start:450 stop:1079 length:630 start_codon:yes stop_codon:yes gene_type:complete
MKVYAEYFNKEDGNAYRRKTLLQFGESTDLIGSAVLINPGSAQPIGNANLDLIQAFYSKNHNLELGDLSLWKSFNPDPTMGQLAKLFNGWYAGKEQTLLGVIQLFNCFYLKEQDMDKALLGFKRGTDFAFNEAHLLGNRPVYFGWGNTGKFGKIKNIAFNIFNSYDIHSTPIYHSVFEENCFYHPGYLNRSFKRNPKSIEIIQKFFALF